MSYLPNIICIAFGVFFFYWVKKRRFKRLNHYGFEEYKSYGNKLFSTFIEGISWFLGMAFVLYGLFL